MTPEEALSIVTSGSAWISQVENVKGKIEEGKYADLAILSDDYLSVPEEDIKSLATVLTVTGGDIVHAANSFAEHAPVAPPAVSPEWSPVVTCLTALEAL